VVVVLAPHQNDSLFNPKVAANTSPVR